MLLTHGILCANNNVVPGRKICNLNQDWKFILQDVKQASEVQYNDSKWQVLSLPHDWAFENPYSKDGAQTQAGGYKIGGIGWYRRDIPLTKMQCTGKRHFIHFDAVYMNSEVWINGHYLGKRPYGYISFEYEITDFVHPGNNVISVRVDNSLEPSARWYHGCGIYGNVSLITTSSVRFSLWNTIIRTNNITDNKANIEINGNLDKKSNPNHPIELECDILSPNGNRVWHKKIKYQKNDSSFTLNTTIKKPLIWDLDMPNLYTLVLKAWDGKIQLDKIEKKFGIRTVKWEAETGFWLNGRNVKLQGVCEHLEAGPIGAAWTENLLKWKIELLKKMGCNAIRTTHNPQLPMFYNLCDEMGMLVVDEVFDGWKRKASEDYGKQAFSEWWERDLRSCIRRDRNHPSVIVYSVGNETGGKVANDLVNVCHEEDPTRLVTSGHSGSTFMDILGINGSSEKKNFINTFHPKDKAFIGTETPHTWQVRGYYRTKTWYRDGYPNKRQDPFETPDLTNKEIFQYEWASPEKWSNKKQHFNSSYDNAFVRINVRQNIQFLRDKPWYSASFRWTGFDYLGEAGYVHGGWPFRAFMGGVIDLAGFRKDDYFLYQSEWTTKPMVHILPHWTHPYMKIGTKIPVWVYTTGDQVELFLNGKSLGKKSKGTEWNKMQCEWIVSWNPGVLEAVAYRKGKEIARTRQITSEVPAKLCVEVDTCSLLEKDDDLHIITISQRDKNGVLYPYGENRTYFSLEGPAEIYSAENGNPVDVETNYHATSRNAFFGLLRLFIRKNNTGEVKLYSASILGDKRLKLGNTITIDFSKTDLKGTKYSPSCEIYYTIDGTEPSINSIRYKHPFSLQKAATVKALIIYRGKEMFRMTESFGPNEGIYWGDDSTNLIDKAAFQAENCKLVNSHIGKSIMNFQSKGYAVLNEKGSYLSLYQENDGGTRKGKLVFSVASEKENNFSVNILNNGNKISEKRVSISKENSGLWRRVEIPLTIYSGANQIKIELVQGKEVCIDWLDIN